MKKLLLAAVACLCLTACSDPKGATNALENLGMTDIKITGYRFFGCGDDTYKTGFTAKRGDREFSGVVCGGWFKGSTVRFD